LSKQGRSFVLRRLQIGLECSTGGSLPGPVGLIAVDAGDSLFRAIFCLVSASALAASHLFTASCLRVAPRIAVKTQSDLSAIVVQYRLIVLRVDDQSLANNFQRASLSALVFFAAPPF